MNCDKETADTNDVETDDTLADSENELASLQTPDWDNSNEHD